MRFKGKIALLLAAIAVTVLTSYPLPISGTAKPRSKHVGNTETQNKS